VRADVVGDDGRAQTFRRLTAHVAGPDGFVRDISLDAIGAGRYGATVPLSRPGTYMVAAKDEVTGEAVGTMGAVLGAGEELRPTGTDRILLGRIASMTGGKMRDTLAGLFDDRAGRRFAYRPVTPPLVILAAVAMLLAVAARRIGVPDVVAAVGQRMRGWRDEAARKRHERAQQAARDQALAIAEQERLRDVILAKRRRDAVPVAADLPPPVKLASLSREPPPAPIPPPPTLGAAATPPLAPPPERPLTAAERLALKRRERR
jgi:hypothetical protein